MVTGKPEHSPSQESYQITLRLFASLRETLVQDCIVLDVPLQVTTFAELRQFLTQVSPQWQQLLGNHAVLGAVNQQMAQDLTPIKHGDEVALFPPVTGG